MGYKRLDHALAKLGWYDKPLGHRKAKDILRGKLCSFVAMYRGWPLAVELAKAIDKDYTRCVRKIADFYTAPEMTASWAIMDHRYGVLMRSLIAQIKLKGPYAVITQSDLGTALNVDPSNKKLDYVFSDYQQTRPLLLGKLKASGWRRDQLLKTQS